MSVGTTFAILQSNNYLSCKVKDIMQKVAAHKKIKTAILSNGNMINYKQLTKIGTNTARP